MTEEKHTAGEPDYCFLKSEWEFTAEWVDRSLVEEQMDGVKPGHVEEVCCLVKAPSKFLACVPEYDDGELNGSKIEWFDTEAEARAAISRATGAA